MSGGLPILTFHALDCSGGVLATDPARFHDTIASLVESGYQSVDLDAWVAAGRPPVERGFAVTFDDGLRSIRNVLDVLIRYRVRSTLFLVAGRMGRDNAWPGQPSWVPRLSLVRWQELPDLQNAGVRFGAHSRTHPDLRRLDDDRLRSELHDARREIEDHSGMPCRLLAYPYGASDPRVRREARRVYQGGFGTRLGHASNSEDRYDISRIDAYYLRPDSARRALLDGTLDRVLRWRRAARRMRRIVTRVAGG